MKLNQVTVGVKDLDRSIEFYQALGLKMIVFSKNHYARFIVSEGQSTFSLHVMDEVIPGTTTVYFELEDLDTRVAELEKDHQWKFDLPPTDQSWLWREAHVHDPDGNKIILYYAGENRENPPWRLKD